MATATVTTLDAVLKQHYVPQRVAFVGYEGNPLLALMPKMTNFGGRNLPIPLMHGGNMRLRQQVRIARHLPRALVD